MINLLTMAFLQSDSAGNTAAAGAAVAGGIGFTIFMLAIALLMIAAMWKVFTKAGEPGWAAIVPIYNLIVLLKIAGKPAWWFLLFIIPFVNLIVAFIVSISIAKAFGKGTGFGIGLALLGPIFYPVLGFSDARYQGVPAA